MSAPAHLFKLTVHLVLAALLTLSFCCSVDAKKRPAPQLNEDVALPSSFLLDYQLGLSQRSALRGSMPLIENTEFNTAGEEAFTRLLGTPQVVSSGLPYRWSLSLINSDVINAYSLPDGEVSVSLGLAKLIGTNAGLWAAVLSHETVHTARRHAVRKYLFELYIAQQVAYYQALVRAGNNNANWALLGLRVSAPIAAAKLSRNLEHEADVQGMMLMAHAG